MTVPVCWKHLNDRVSGWQKLIKPLITVRIVSCFSLSWMLKAPWFVQSFANERGKVSCLTLFLSLFLSLLPGHKRLFKVFLNVTGDNPKATLIWVLYLSRMSLARAKIRSAHILGDFTSREEWRVQNLRLQLVPNEDKCLRWGGARRTDKVLAWDVWSRAGLPALLEQGDSKGKGETPRGALPGLSRPRGWHQGPVPGPALPPSGHRLLLLCGEELPAEEAAALGQLKGNWFMAGCRALPHAGSPSSGELCVVSDVPFIHGYRQDVSLR